MQLDLILVCVQPRDKNRKQFVGYIRRESMVVIGKRNQEFPIKKSMCTHTGKYMHLPKDG